MLWFDEYYDEENYRMDSTLRAAGGAGLALDLGVGVDLGEVLLPGEEPQRHHQRLVAVVAAAPVALAEGAGEGDLSDLLGRSEPIEPGHERIL